MDWPAVLIKITGVLLCGFTLRSIYQHIRARVEKRTAGRSNEGQEQSTVEFILNHLILYVFLAFLLTFSIGMIVNN
jgi:hypothetical protein